jgi:hypothetical protein
LGWGLQGGQGEPRIGKPDLLGIFAEYLVGGLDQHALMLCHCLPARLIDAISDNQLMNFGHKRTV